MIKGYFIFSILIFTSKLSEAQISPPGLGNTNLSTWGAFALRQALDTTSQKQSVTYIGFAGISHPDNYNAFQKPGMLIINEEFYHQFHKSFQYSVALSYRRQHEYIDIAPFEKNEPSIKQEFRVYSRSSFLWKNSNLKFVGTFRQEFRKFFTPDFQDWNETYQFRSRVRSQLALNLDKNKIHKLILSAELLFSVSKTLSPTPTWSKFNYREGRFCLYYSIDPKKYPFIFNIGYMNNLVGTKNPHSGHYAALDIIWENPLDLFKSKKGNHVEGLE